MCAVTVSVSNNQARGADVEAKARERWPLETLEAEWADLVFVESGTGFESGGPCEVKSCQHRICRDTRNGRWFISKHAHERLLEAEGWYILAVLRNFDVERMGLVSARSVDELIDSWWDAGRGGESVSAFVQLPWSLIFDSLEVPE